MPSSNAAARVSGRRYRSNRRGCKGTILPSIDLMGHVTAHSVGIGAMLPRGYHAGAAPAHERMSRGNRDERSQIPGARACNLRPKRVAGILSRFELRERFAEMKSI